MKKNNYSGTIIVYTMVLVVLGVFMATIILNVAVELSVEYDRRNIEIELGNIIKTKGELAFKYSNFTNSNGNGFIDQLSCPNGLSMSGNTLVTNNIDTELQILQNIPMCRSNTTHSGSNIDIYFNSDYTDLFFAEYDGEQINVNSGSLSGNFGDSDSTVLTIPDTSYLSPDGIDDNFNSDDYTLFSTGTTLYPSGYIDDDADGRKFLYGYIIEGSGLYNVLWTNDEVRDYIRNNPYNNDGYNIGMGDSSSARLFVDINKNHRIYLYRINKDQYTETNELIVEELLSGTGQTAGVGYLQNDFSIGSSSTGAYMFDFAQNDYAMFIKNNGTGSLLYRIQAQDATSGSGIYISPLNDTDPSLMSYLGYHIFVDDEGKLIGNIDKVYGIKEFVTP